MAHVPDWELDYPFLRRRWTFANFVEALAFVERVAEVAEAEGHHPDVHLTSYRELELVLCTHAIDGLTDNDFVPARRVGELWRYGSWFRNARQSFEMSPRSLTFVIAAVSKVTSF